MLVSLGNPSPARMEALAAQLADKPLTYPEVGATRHPDSMPAGYTHDRWSVRVGGDRRAYELGRDALTNWQSHRALGARLTPENPPLRPDQVVLFTIPTGPFQTLVPCRIVYVSEEDERFGFAYGTLPGHPERGEESFHIVRIPSGEVTFEIVAFSRPADLAVRLAGPVARWMQRRGTRTYLEGVRRYVEDHLPPHRSDGP